LRSVSWATVLSRLPIAKGDVMGNSNSKMRDLDHEQKYSHFLGDKSDVDL
jgi:hypothetical protein